MGVRVPINDEVVLNKKYKRRFWLEFRKQIGRQVMVWPALIFLIIFSYIPMYGVVLAFKDYMISKGILGSPWVGFKHFVALFRTPFLVTSIRNTIVISMLSILIVFPAPIVLALLMNELKSDRFKKVIQTISYLPHFISWVIITGMIYIFLSRDGLINNLLSAIGILDKPIYFLSEQNAFYPIIIISDLWKSTGWGTIIYFAAISSINPEIYEAGIVDGTNRLTQAWHITLPSIRETIIILFIFSVSSILNSNFDQIYLLQNDIVLNVAETIDTYVFKQGIGQGMYSFATAAGLFKALVAFMLLFLANAISKKITEEGVF